jgi:hypothetical protein
LRAVVDVNVIVSALINPQGPPGSVVTAALQRRFVIVVCPALLAEARDVVHRRSLRRFFDADDADDLLTAVAGVADEAPDSVDPPWSDAMPTTTTSSRSPAVQRRSSSPGTLTCLPSISTIWWSARRGHFSRRSTPAEPAPVRTRSRTSRQKPAYRVSCRGERILSRGNHGSICFRWPQMRSPITAAARSSVSAIQWL